MRLKVVLKLKKKIKKTKVQVNIVKVKLIKKVNQRIKVVKVKIKKRIKIKKRKNKEIIIFFIHFFIKVVVLLSYEINFLRSEITGEIIIIFLETLKQYFFCK